MTNVSNYLESQATHNSFYSLTCRVFYMYTKGGMFLQDIQYEYMVFKKIIIDLKYNMYSNIGPFKMQMQMQIRVNESMTVTFYSVSKKSFIVDGTRCHKLHHPVARWYKSAERDKDNSRDLYVVILVLNMRSYSVNFKSKEEVGVQNINIDGIIDSQRNVRFLYAQIYPMSSS
ncbi:hypothetical protein PHYBLDRAFT_174333 [Phycomyces blakesleeanus NRRL 1555(-)]|uniref:Uncharacterized protein n=1 Tax=Phycomyces blakesleeanus (strain ATCC 8743b / DSM 1359 / FGSC 10004 / NBRC 33097 / NRRL 1555) TaxID=763407 RepID=A0A162WI55_PHYB8|nr:hypothetical protein PHYBLDRAFT_174333 [Phycomyces blakesleeanus NRRL 1555(-)]OAD67295.1 hypothetical protein PHYBLDRAFT_174333 [Phycomyces blakesleeanus NRRL 1555(-)]|eukprot:XP_018285335.1 hypothetical protein PHYBLDRAFT_174333 [Phycomyces blakesleeanus NRRL 1555(-)]